MLPEIFLALQFYFSFDLNIITDEPLHPMVKEALQDQGPMPAYEENAHVYLMGLVAGEGDDSFEVGKERFISMGDTYSNGDRQAYKVYPKENWTEIISEEKLCTLGAGDKSKQIKCFDKLTTSCDVKATLINEYQYVLDNYKKLNQASQIRSPSIYSTTDWHTLEVFRLVSILDDYHRMYRMQCVQGSDKTDLIESVVTKARYLKGSKATTDDWLLNAGLLLILKDFYHGKVYLYRSGFEDLKQLPDSFFRLQTKDESSLRKVMYRQIKSSVNTLKVGLKEVHEETEDGDQLVPPLYKENLTINGYSLSSIKVTLNSEIPIGQYLENRILTSPRSSTKWWQIGNYMGEILIRVSAPLWIDTSVDLNNLDLTIRLSDIVINYTELVDNNQLSDLPLSKRNPYDNSLPYFDESGKWLCFKVPEELKSQDECMYLH